MTVAPVVVRAGLAIVAVALAGAFVFGVWHVVVGGLVNGNARAGVFGLALASVTGAILAALTVLIRRPDRHG